MIRLSSDKDQRNKSVSRSLLLSVKEPLVSLTDKMVSHLGEDWFDVGSGQSLGSNKGLQSAQESESTAEKKTHTLEFTLVNKIMGDMPLLGTVLLFVKSRSVHTKRNSVRYVYLKISIRYSVHNG